jgi:hypothetical protein
MSELLPAPQSPLNPDAEWGSVTGGEDEARQIARDALEVERIITVELRLITEQGDVGRVPTPVRDDLAAVIRATYGTR